ncbi:MAG: substrate-binding domain-containing protein [Candidatus Schekmanbacteria bacterium]|nr:substrate-binding domain-containing protein [Candidatus Schekmanbacteria bacterium]
MLKRALVPLALAISAFFSMVITTPGSAGDALEVWGSTTCQKRFLEPAAEALAKATGVQIKVLGVGTGKGLAALVEGKAVVSAASEDLAGAKESAKKANPGLSIPDNLQFHQLGEDVIVPIVHKDNPVTSLSWEQLAGLASGKIASWKDVGGSDLPVVVVTSHAGSATRAVFNELVMSKAPYVAGAIEVSSTRLEINEVAKSLGAIGAVSKTFVEANPEGVKVVESKAITRPLALITVGAPTPAAQKVIDFFRSEEGKKYVQ